MKHIFISLTALLIFTFLSQTAFADSAYVLPYPSTMPGGISYKLHIAWETLMQYWYFGSFGQFDYNLKESDKYLVEAKTLFEYQQYLLGITALQKSNTYFSKTFPNLTKAQSEGKDITDKRMLLKEASAKHIEILENMKKTTPDSFNWTPEKIQATQLMLHNAINQAIMQRMNYL